MCTEYTVQRIYRLQTIQLDKQYVIIVSFWYKDKIKHDHLRKLQPLRLVFNVFEQITHCENEMNFYFKNIQYKFSFPGLLGITNSC